MANKNLFNNSGAITLLNVTFAEPYKWMHVMFNLEVLKDVFKNCMIFIDICEMYVFTTLPKNILLDLQKLLINASCSVCFDEIDQLWTLYGFKHTYLVYWSTDNKCRVIHKCSKSENVFKCVCQIKHAHIAPIFKVTLRSLVKKRKIFKSDTKGKIYHRNVDVYTVNYITRQKYKINSNDSFIQQRIENKHVLQVSRGIVPLKAAKKVIPARNEHPCVVNPINGEYPSQVSNDSASAEIDCNTGSFPIPRGFMGIGPLQESIEPILPFENSNVVIGSVARTPRYPEYVLYSVRLETYSLWERRHPSPTKLCEAGFFFTNRDDLVRCYQCGIGLRDFTDDDDPLIEHVKLSESCEYLLDYLGPTALAAIKSRLRYQDVEQIRQSQLERQSEGPELRYNYRHPELCTYEARMKTFSRWPRTLIQTPERLASAGLYYTGIEDHVRCFACDGGLRKWDPEDDPWTEHCRWFPACPFAREQKGDEYIALIQASVEDEGCGGFIKKKLEN